jgi:hypothetical protein
MNLAKPSRKKDMQEPALVGPVLPNIHDAMRYRDEMI